MLRSLVGSEMCIRDSMTTVHTQLADVNARTKLLSKARSWLPSDGLFAPSAEGPRTPRAAHWEEKVSQRAQSPSAKSHPRAPSAWRLRAPAAMESASRGSPSITAGEAPSRQKAGAPAAPQVRRRNGRDCAPHQPTMTGTRSSPPLSPLRPDSPHRALHTELLIHPFSSRAQVNFMLAGVERLRQVQQGAAARHAHELCGGHRLRSGEAVAAGGIARVR